MFIYYKNELIRKKDPIFTDSDSKFGRAQFYAAEKYIGKIKIETFLFNVIVLWLFSIMLFIFLYYELFRKFVDSLSNIKWKKLNNGR